MGDTSSSCSTSYIEVAKEVGAWQLERRQCLALSGKPTSCIAITITGHNANLCIA